MRNVYIYLYLLFPCLSRIFHKNNEFCPVYGAPSGPGVGVAEGGGVTVFSVLTPGTSSAKEKVTSLYSLSMETV